MAGEDYSNSALRHLIDAEMLAIHERWGGAGHLVGFAAECAIKHRLGSLKPASDPIKGHLPHLIEIAKKHVCGRKDTSLLYLLKMTNLMAGWKVEQRYAKDGEVKKENFELWKAHASRLINAANIRRGL